MVALDTYWQISGKYPKGRAKAWIERLCETYGGEATARALGKVDRESSTVIQDAESILARESAIVHAKERARRELEKNEAQRDRLDRAEGRSRGPAPALDPGEYDRLIREVKG